MPGKHTRVTVYCKISTVRLEASLAVGVSDVQRITKERGGFIKNVVTFLF